jgi:protein TonB
VLKRQGDPDAVLSVAPVGPGPTKIEDNQIYNTAGIEPNFRVVWLNSTSMGDNYRAPEEEGLRGKVYVTWWKRWFIN